MLQNNILYTEYTYCGKGQLFNETIAKKGAGASIALKKGLDRRNMAVIQVPIQLILLLLNLMVRRDSV